MHLSNPRKWVSQNYAEKKGKNYVNTQKELNRSRVERDRDLEDKAAGKRCRSQPRGRGKVAGKRKEISKNRRGQGGGLQRGSKQNDKR